MKTKLENSWKEFCNSSIANALSNLKKNNSKYNNICQQHSARSAQIRHILHTPITDLKAKHIESIKEYLILIQEKQEFEKNAIYSQGICDSFAITEKFR